MTVLRVTLIAAGLAFAIGLGGCGNKSHAPKPNAPAGSATTAPTDAPSFASNLYVVPQNRAAGFYGEKAEAYFTPDRTIISALEGALPMFLGSSDDPRAQTITPKLERYKRQYVGVVIKGQKMVFGNFFCNSKLSVKRPQLIDDGGSCFFTVLFDISSRTFPQLQINGDA